MVGCWATSTETLCKFPGAPAHSTVSFSNDTLTTGAIATYTCERGFELLGPARRVCESTGEWLPEGIPFCGKFQIVPFLISTNIQDTNAWNIVVYNYITI